MPVTAETDSPKAVDPQQKGGSRDGLSTDVSSPKARELGFSRGLNLDPGHEDDGWVVPAPVTLRDGTRLQLYKDGEALAAGYEAIKHAKRRIALETYIYASDDTGRAICELLCKKARDGVKVYVVYDGVGSMLADRSMFNEMRHAGVHVREFHPIRPWESRFGWRPFNRDHRKLLLIDDHIAGLGGLNVGTRYAGSWVLRLARVTQSAVDPEHLWRDTAIGLVGPSAKMFARSFAMVWRYAHHGGPVRRTAYFAGLSNIRPDKGPRLGKQRHRLSSGRIGSPDDVMANNADVACLAAAPTLSSYLRPVLHRLIRQARREILVTMAYFAPDDQLIDELCDAARRGVRVRMVFAGRSDVRVMVIAQRSFYERLLDAGVEVYERQHVMLHAKTLVVDGRLSLVGSTNLDYRSIEFNCELSALVRDETFGGQMRDLFENDVRYSHRFTPDEWSGRPMLDRLVQWLVSRSRYFL